MSKLKTSVNTVQRLNPYGLKNRPFLIGELLQNHGKLEKAKQLPVLSLLGLKQVGEFLKNDDNNKV